jgi:hypothetical protein
MTDTAITSEHHERWTRHQFQVRVRVVDKNGGSIRNSVAVPRSTGEQALDYIKREQRKFERCGHNREFDYYWGANAEVPGCASAYVTRWTIESCH